MLAHGLRKKYMALLLSMSIILAFGGCNRNTTSENEEGSNLTEAVNEGDPKIADETEPDYADDGYVNLNFSYAEYSIPEVSEVTNLKYAMPHTGAECEEAEEKILANIERMAGTADVSNLVYWKQKGAEVGSDTISAAEVPTEEKNKYYYCTYNDGKYTALSYNGGGMVEMADSLLWAELAGSEVFDENYLPTYRPLFVEDAVLVQEYMLPDDSIEGISYTLMDGELSLTDAVAFAEEEMKNYYFARSDYLEFEVYEIDVYQLATGEYYYYFFLQGTLDGIAVNYESGGTANSDDYLTDDGYKSVVGVEDQVAMIYSDRISYFWVNMGYENAEVETVDGSDIITLDEACAIISENVTTESSFNVTLVTMEYYVVDHMSYIDPPRSDKWNDYREVRLMYKLSINNPRVLGYSSVDFLVDAVTGDFYTYVD